MPEFGFGKIVVIMLVALLVFGANEAGAQYVAVPAGTYNLRVRPNGRVVVRGRAYASPLVDTAVFPTTVVLPTTTTTTTTTLAEPMLSETRVIESTPVVTETQLVRTVPLMPRTYVTTVPTITTRPLFARPLYPRRYLVPSVPVYGTRTIVTPYPW